MKSQINTSLQKPLSVDKMENQKPSSFNRRKFLTNTAKVVGVGAAGYIYFSGRDNEVTTVETPPMNKHVFLTKPYLYTISPNRMSVRWITNKPSYAWVEYGLEADKLHQKALLVNDGLVNAYDRIHEIYLEDLEAGKQYHYRVVAKEVLRFEQEDTISYGETIYSAVYSFNTSSEHAEEVNWVVLNDIHDTPASFPLLLQLNKNIAFDYVFLNGDMFDYQAGEEQIIEHLIKPCTEVFASQKPMLYVRGNHEMRGKFAHQLKEYFSYPQHQFYHYQWGHVFSIVLDSGEEEIQTGFDQSDLYREKQAKWLEEIMQSKQYQSAKYRVVQMHIPPFYSFDQKGSRHCKQVFSPLFNRYQVDLVIAGHTHTFGIHPPVPDQHNYPIVIGGGPKPGNRTIIHVKANEQQLQLQMLKDDGSIIGEYKIEAKR